MVGDDVEFLHRPLESQDRVVTMGERRQTRGQPRGNSGRYYTTRIDTDPMMPIQRTTRQIDYQELPQIDYPQLPRTTRQIDYQQPSRDWRIEAPVSSYTPAMPELPVRVQARPHPVLAPGKRGVERGSPRFPVKKVPRRRPHGLALAGMAMLVIVAVWLIIPLLTSLWQINLDNWRYGNPRTYQQDAVVGHADSAENPSHFIALNLNQHIEVVEFPGGDPSHAKVYIGPTLLGTHQELVVATLTFKDVNGDGKPDMLINVEDSHIIFINEKGKFRPARPGEHISTPGL